MLLVKRVFVFNSVEEGKLKAKFTTGQLQEGCLHFSTQPSSFLSFLVLWFLQQSVLTVLSDLSFLQQDFSVLSDFVAQA